MGSGLTLGRDDDCGVVLSQDDVSRHHARVAPCAEGILLEDLGSANGTWVGDQRLERHVLAPREPFRLGHSWFLVEPDPPALPAPATRSAPWPIMLGCVGALAFGLLVALGGLLAWKLRTAAAGRPATAAERPGPAVATTASVPLAEADVLRFTLRVASNPLPGECRAMPAGWMPPLLEVTVAARVSSTGAFTFSGDWQDAGGGHHLEGTGQWKDERLSVRGRWTTQGVGQSDEGTFSGAGQRLLGSWFGERLEGGFRSRLDATTATCQEPISNGYSRIDALLW